jgi:hypothetical protein
LSQVRRLEQIPPALNVVGTDQIAVWQGGRTRISTISDISAAAVGVALGPVTTAIASLAATKANAADLGTASTFSVEALAAPGNAVGDSIGAKLGLTRNGLASAKIPAVILAIALAGYATLGDRAFGMPMVRTIASDLDPTKIADGSTPTGYWKLNSKDAVDVSWFGAVGDGTTEDSVAFQAAANHAAPIVLVPAGTFIVRNVVVPVNKKVAGRGSLLTGIHGPVAAHTFIMQGQGSNHFTGFNMNGRNIGQRGLSIRGAQTHVDDIRSSNFVDGIHNENGVFLRFTDVITNDNSRAGLYSADGMNTCWFTRFWSLQNDGYGCFFTYTTTTDGAAPCQAINMNSCFFFGCITGGVWFEKNTFDFSFHAGSIDGQQGTGIRFGPGLANGGNLYFTSSFLGAGSGASIDVGSGYNNVTVTGCTLGNGFNGIIVRADATHRCANVTLTGVQFNNQRDAVVFLDSVVGATLYSCDFGIVGPGLDIVSPQSFADPNQPKVKVRDCTFRKANPLGSAYNIDVRDCDGYKTSGRGKIQILAGTTGSTVSHGARETPIGVNVTALRSGLGACWVENITSTTFDIKSTNAAPAGGADIAYQFWAY